MNDGGGWPALICGGARGVPDCCSNAVSVCVDSDGGDAAPLALALGRSGVDFGAMPPKPFDGTLANDDGELESAGNFGDDGEIAASDSFGTGTGLPPLITGTSNAFDGALSGLPPPSGALSPAGDGAAPKPANESGVGVVFGMKQIDDSFLANQQLQVAFLPNEPAVHVVMFTQPLSGSAMESFEHSVQHRPPSHGSIDTMLSGERLG